MSVSGWLASSTSTTPTGSTRRWATGHPASTLPSRARLGHSENNTRGLTFAGLVVANLGLILTNRSWSRTIPAMMKEPNRALWWVVGGAAVFLAMVIYLPILLDLFPFAPLHTIDMAICLLAGAVSVLWFEGLKILRRAKAAGEPLSHSMIRPH